MKNIKYHLALTDSEYSLIINSLNNLRNNLIAQGRYLRKTKRYNALCVDIEGLVTDYLGLVVVYENIAEDDPNKIAFLSNGMTALKLKPMLRANIPIRETMRLFLTALFPAVSDFPKKNGCLNM